MIKLTVDQLQRLVAGSEGMLELAIANLVRKDHGYVIAGLPDDMFMDLIRRGLATARGYGLNTPQQLGGFVMLQFEVGPEFHRHRDIQAVLQDAQFSPQQKFDKIATGMPDHVWTEVEAALDRQTWYPELREDSQDDCAWGPAFATPTSPASSTASRPTATPPRAS